MANPVLLLITSGNHSQLYGGWGYDGSIFCCYPFICFSEIEVASQVKALTKQSAKSLAGRADWVFSPFVGLQFEMWAWSSEKLVCPWSEA
jgi:hypothetical protein